MSGPTWTLLHRTAYNNTCIVYVYLLDIPKQPTCMKLRTGEFYEHILSCAM